MSSRLLTIASISAILLNLVAAAPAPTLIKRDGPCQLITTQYGDAIGDTPEIEIRGAASFGEIEEDVYMTTGTTVQIYGQVVGLYGITSPASDTVAVTSTADTWPNLDLSFVYKDQSWTSADSNCDLGEWLQNSFGGGQLKATGQVLAHRSVTCDYTCSG